jgi:hypothetical protein
VELFNHNRRLGKFSTLSMVRFAVIESGCDRSIVFDTISTAAKWGSVVSWECEELDEWCKERFQAGDPKGQWLKTILEELRTTSQSGNNYSSSVADCKRLAIIQLDSSTGDYTGGVEDQLVVRPSKYEQVRSSSLFTSSRFFSKPNSIILAFFFFYQWNWQVRP